MNKPFVCDCHCDICKALCDFRGRPIFIKFRCPTYFGTVGTVRDIKNNLVILDYLYGGVSITCCDNNCYIVPVEPS